MPNTTNGWDQSKRDIFHRFDYQKHDLEKLVTSVEVLSGKLNKYVVDFEVFKKEMQIKSGIWGIIGGCVPVALGILIWLLQAVIQK